MMISGIDIQHMQEDASEQKQKDCEAYLLTLRQAAKEFREEMAAGIESMYGKVIAIK
jgi:hypothetical protein